MTLKQALRMFGLRAEFYLQNKKSQEFVVGLLQYDTTDVLTELKNVIGFASQDPRFKEKLPSRNYFLTAVYRNMQKRKPEPVAFAPEVKALIDKVLKGWGHDDCADTNDNQRGSNRERFGDREKNSRV